MRREVAEVRQRAALMHAVVRTKSIATLSLVIERVRFLVSPVASDKLMT